MSAEFPLLLDESNAVRCLALVDDEDPAKIMATACYRIFEFAESKPSLKVAGLGLIVTDPEARGQGLATKLILMAEDRARREGAALSILWSDLASFYEKNGYLVSGAELQWVLSADAKQLALNRFRAELPPPRLNFRPLDIGDPQMAALYPTAGIGPVRDWSTYSRFSRLENCEAWGAFEGPKLRSYGILGKGRDLPRTVHELCGNLRDTPELLRFLFESRPETERLQLPIDHPWRSELEHWLGKGETSALGFFKLLEPRRFLDWSQGTGRLPAGLIWDLNAQNHLRLRWAGETVFEASDPSVLIQLLLGPYHPTELEGLPAALEEALKGLPLPLPLYFWGLDSV